MPEGGARGAVSLALILALTMSAPSAIAQEQTTAPNKYDHQFQGRMTIARAAMREAVRLAASASSIIEIVQQGGTSVASDWSRVRQLAPHTELIVTDRSASPVHGYFLAADDSELAVSNGGVEHIARMDVVEVRVLKRRDFNSVANSASFRWGVIIGVAAGLTTAGLTLHSYCRTNTCDTAPAVAIGGYTMLGFMVGGGIGALAAVGSKIETLIYRAP